VYEQPLSGLLMEAGRELSKPDFIEKVRRVLGKAKDS
jgi:hypothetical protein